MRKILTTIVAALGFVAFAAAAQAGCASKLDVADSDSTTVATDGATTKPILQEQSGG